ncbi:MAG TPA: hypothetical protein PKZ36_02770 [Candidatus Paceibacterota bacterium]|nr:hypothetical protein [Candidatus Paceibacterota bacterium]HPT18302.1 hypothetical protein [Candidatus Paceibacterota bacterium]
MEKFERQQDLNENKKDKYLYGDLSKISTEELKSALKSFSTDKNPELHTRVEGELLARKEITVRKDFINNGKTIGYPTKIKEGKQFSNMN